MNHHVFKDLVPSYLDNLTSEETKRLMEEHMLDCEDCREYLKEMQEELSVESTEEQKIEKRNIDYFKKVKSKNKKKMFTIVGSLLSIFLVIGVGWYIIFVHMWIVKEKDVELAIAQQDQTVTLSFQTKHDKRFIIPIEHSGADSNMIVVYEKWNDFSEASNLLKDGSNVRFTFLDENTLLLHNGKERKLTEKDKLYIKYKDRTEEIVLKDLYKPQNK
ncbi:zf-HC2 domain-containing protein [Sporosarcina sp. Te-1]|uniref:zf-HC2 domain-containing protein n=1 Tax=Sporosarcina sp. Te-1 TaxID=2818390 RepID=UPI001A9ED776|nr:zf-HC2 domain-containing protein [Sporosarcina sp. Te-1]QTD39521.1 zf-HC2 domain-containing protein [Sporosarcina sp. Te-1]